MSTSLLSECEGGERDDLSPVDFLTGPPSAVRGLVAAATDQTTTAGVGPPVLLEVLGRAGVAT